MTSAQELELQNRLRRLEAENDELRSKYALSLAMEQESSGKMGDALSSVNTTLKWERATEQLREQLILKEREF